MNIKLLTKTELKDAIDFIWKVFLEFEAVNYSADNKEAFYDAINNEDYLDMLTSYGAFIDGNLVGIIASRNEGSHVALFFVDGKYQKQGIGRKLFEKLISESSCKCIIVHSSFYAKDIYTKLGFIQSGDIKEEDGIKYIPMEYKR